MAEITSAEGVIAYIKQSDKKAIEIYRKGETSGGNAMPIFEYNGNSNFKAVEAFKEWAQIFSGNGTNLSEYKLVVSDGIDPNSTETKETQNAKKRHSSMAIMFVLNATPNIGMRRDPSTGDVIYIAGPNQQPQAPYPGTGIDLTKYVAKEEMQAAIAHAILNAQLQERMNNLEAENLQLHRELRDLYEEDEDIEEEDEEDGISGVMKIWTPDKVKELITGIKDGYLEIKGANSKIEGAQKLNQVAGPNEAATAEVEIPKDAIPGKYPAYVTPTDANKDLIHADQQLKMQEALSRIYAKDFHIGDDLLIIAMIAENKPNRFKGLIESLREE